ncbi:polyribonucleotide nucleotidyltransferase [Bythopirellula polymerisocia]|uniref:Polyribonucleotide nucleotidyltransferase n=1 Tax=Bythopirellula polymerisocia TaxID=2528003 RepID=A0A5C6CP33_9BACT|nr:polyribonucleotide nucleotidyltransferase [Bythopirellula polymerisocia]TWU24499.1 Polyribonucleotide nucleotidyltransferase [Bythopirellula polymerisocia]
MNKIRVEKQIGSGIFSIETGLLAKQAAGACIVQYGDTTVLCAAAGGPSRPGTDFFPLTCDYRERTAAAGKFPGGFMKREGRPTTKETLTARLMDRPIRPMFPEGYNDEVQVQAFVMSSDKQSDGDVLAMNGACAALAISPLPFHGPLASVRVGYVDGEFIPFPTQDDLESSSLDLIVSGNKDAVLMIEGFAREMPEDTMAEAIMAAHGFIRELCELQEELIAKVGTEKIAYEAPASDGLFDELEKKFGKRFSDANLIDGKHARYEAVVALREEALAALIPDPAADGAYKLESFYKNWHDLEARVSREQILSGTRSDGRKSDELRDIYCEVDLLPRVHGSALFQRGETQAFVTVTLGTGRDEQRVDGLFDEYTKRFMLDYNFPSFSVGECRPIRGPGRREIGHGALAERSVNPVLPDHDKFPYTIRVISDILESNGSSSMASVCGATLGLMAAGVPISNPVAGISIGLVKEGEKWSLLTDIIGNEDHFGDMDFKIAGTQNGITGIQLDLKIKGISEEIIRATLKQSREARIEILRKIISAIPRPRTTTSETAPRLLRTKINPEKIGLLIGPGGKTIRGIQEEVGCTIDVDEDGTVTVAAADQAGAEAGLARVDALTASVQVGKIYEGRVTSVKDFGAFVEILPGRDGLCHISELSNEYVGNVGDVCSVGDRMKVKVILVDEQDRVKLSRRAAMEELGEQEAEPADAAT